MKVIINNSVKWYTLMQCTPGDTYMRKNGGDYIWLRTKDNSIVCLNTGVVFDTAHVGQFRFTPVKAEVVV